MSKKVKPTIEIISTRTRAMHDAMRRGEEAARLAQACLEVEPEIEVRRKSELV